MQTCPRLIECYSCLCWTKSRVAGSALQDSYHRSLPDPTQDETYLTDNPTQPLHIKWNRRAMILNIVSARHHRRACKSECVINNDLSTSGLPDLFASPELACAASSRHRAESSVTHRPTIRPPHSPSGHVRRAQAMPRDIEACTGRTTTSSSKKIICCVGATASTSPFREALPVWKVSSLSCWTDDELRTVGR